MGRRMGLGLFSCCGGFCLFISTLCAWSEEIQFHRGEMSLSLISDWVACLIATQMAHPRLENNKLPT